MAGAAHEGELGFPPRPPFPVTDPDISWPAALAEIAAAIPDRIAIDDDTEQITYVGLLQRVNRAARAILDADPDGHAPVVVLARQGVGAVVGFLAPLHAGRIGAPIDAGEPTERLRRLVDASLATTILTEERYLEVARAVVGDRRRIITLDDTDQFDDTAPDVPVDGPTPGYIVFTSGSTGAPKGVVIAHPHLVRDMIAQSDITTFPLDARVPLIASFGFSAAIGQVIFPLLIGATICPFDLPSGSARRLAEWVSTHRITALQIVPSLMRALTGLEPPVTMPSVQTVTLSGETTYGRDVRRARTVFGADTVFINSFGSTEAYTIASYVVGPEDAPDDGPLPAGTLSPGLTATVVDVDSDAPVRAGEAGRLVVVADYMSHGYWNDPELTAAHYFTAPDGRQGFRTSDLVRFRPDGNLEHIGRLDSRVKVRGAMVATSEVERALLTLDGIADAAVVGTPADDGGTQLIAYVVGDGSTALSAWKLRRDLAHRLPTTMLPATFVAVAELPRTVRGKVDRAALPPQPSRAAPPYRAPIGNEHELAELFAEVLGLERVGVDDDFFDLGGDSLGVVELIAGISERFGVDVPSTTLLDAPTVGRLAPRLGRRRHRSASIVVPLSAERPGTPIFCVTGGGAPALSLRAFADAVETLPVFGIQPRGLEERALPDRSVAAAAKRAVRELRATWSEGPYTIAGYSFGALIAFEVARRLEAAGQDAGLLVILDSVPRFREDKRRLGARRRAKKLALMTTGPFPRRGLRQYERFLELNTLMAADYTPRGTYGGSLLLVRTHVELEDHVQGRRTQRDLGWSSIVTGPITVVDVPGDHHDMLRSPVVADVAAAVRQMLTSDAPASMPR